MANQRFAIDGDDDLRFANRCQQYFANLEFHNERATLSVVRKRHDQLLISVRNKIRNLMKLKGLTEQKELANAAGLEYLAVHTFIKGGKPHAQMWWLDRLARALGTTLVELLSESEPVAENHPELRPDVRRVAERLNRLAPEEVRGLVDVWNLFDSQRRRGQPQPSALGLGLKKATPGTRRTPDAQAR